MAEFTPEWDWFSHNIPLLERSLERIKGIQLNALEIGCFEGRSTCWLMDNILKHPDSKLTCVDTFKGSAEHQSLEFNWKEIEERFYNNIKPYETKILTMVQDSYSFLVADESEYDLIYIDGSHEAKDVLTDAVLAHHHLKKNGILIFDDYLWKNLWNTYDSPKKAIDAFIDVFGDIYTPITIAYQVILRRDVV